MFESVWFSDFMNSLNGPVFPLLVWSLAVLLMSLYLGLGKIGHSFREAFSKSRVFQQFLMSFFLTIIFASVVLAAVVGYANTLR